MSFAGVMFPVGLLMPQIAGCSTLTVSFGAFAQSTSSLITLKRSTLGPEKRSQEIMNNGIIINKYVKMNNFFLIESILPYQSERVKAKIFRKDFTQRHKGTKNTKKNLRFLFEIFSFYFLYFCFSRKYHRKKRNLTDKNFVIFVSFVPL